MGRPRKSDIAMDVDSTEVVNLTAGDVLELRQSYAAIAEHSARVARIMGRLAGLDEATALPALPSGDLLADGSAEKRKRKRKRDPNAPKRPASSFLMFLLEHRPIMRERHPNLSYSELMKEIGAMWKGLPSKDREAYRLRYEANRETFVKEQQAYVASKFEGETGGKMASTTMTKTVPDHMADLQSVDPSSEEEEDVSESESGSPSASGSEASESESDSDADKPVLLFSPAATSKKLKTAATGSVSKAQKPIKSEKKSKASGKK